jgi:hypothetical protein
LKGNVVCPDYEEVGEKMNRLAKQRNHKQRVSGTSSTEIFLRDVSAIASFLFVIFLGGFAPGSHAEGKLASPTGYYETKSGPEGEHNRLCIYDEKRGKFRVVITTVYCKPSMSADCADAKIAEATFLASLKNGMLNSPNKKSCDLSLSFKGGSAFIEQGRKECGAELPYENAAGQYFRKEHNLTDDSCSP